jgi:hypothetical protein
MSEYGNRKVMCVPSALQIEDVRKLIAESKEKSTTNWQNAEYVKIKMGKYLINIIFFGVYLIIGSLALYHVTFPISYDFMMSDRYGALWFMWYVYAWFVVMMLIRQPFINKNRRIYEKCVRNGSIVENVFKDSEKQILDVYDNVMKFIDSYGHMADDTGYTYSLNETNDTLVVEHSMPIGIKQEKYYFGPYLAQIVDEEGGVIDFSKLDALYGLV